MVLPQQLVFNNPADLPIKNIKIIGNIGEQINDYKKLHSSPGSNVSHCNFNSIQTQAVAYGGPKLGMSNRVKNIYQTNNFNEIKNLENQCSDDLTPIYKGSENLKSWVAFMDEDATQFVIRWDNNGSYIYSFPLSITPASSYANNTDPNAKYIALVQFGVYSASTGLCGTHTYKFGLTCAIPGVSAALMIAITVGKLMNSRFMYLVNEFAILLTQAANQMNIAAEFYTPKEAEGTLAGHIDFICNFIADQFYSTMFNFSRIQIFNWDTYSQWTINTQAIINASYPAGLEDPSKVYITYAAFNGSAFYPQCLVKPDNTVGYSLYLYYGHGTSITQVALQVGRAINPIEGCTYAFSVPPTGPVQNLSGAFIDPQVFLQNTKTTDWVRNQLTVSTTNSVPVTATIDHTQEKYPNIIININKGNPQSLL
ncbi:hypothetical protein CYY_003368 [Polysphondylium violaceum]|uniref:Uncharacterized protein n=1 Tax=Polysphondylium violaceum TaxID=133409 RepID=A0A8J4PZU4_9MYCE|nr:hypothetical protein CYY_003368 [Polysphondylium violaceum]